MSMPDFSCRSPESELMDEDDIPFAEFHACLRELEKINVLTLAHRPTLAWMRRVYSFHKAPLYLLDAGSGGGDMLRRLAGQAQQHKRTVKLVGVDLNPWSKDSAEIDTPPSLPISYQTGNVFEFKPDANLDLITSSLFTHHLSDAQIVDFIQWMDKTARRGWFINDLHRHPVPFYFIKYAVHIFSRNRLIRSDAPISVARAFTKMDWKNILQNAGIPLNSIRIKWYFPFRYCVSCIKS